jgi:dihydrofolate reductase
VDLILQHARSQSSETLGVITMGIRHQRADPGNAEEVRKLKAQSGKDILKYGTGPLDRVLIGEDLLDELCIVLYPFVLGHGPRFFEKIDFTKPPSTWHCRT